MPLRKTLTLAVIGDPVSHSLSPAMQNAALRALKLSYRYRAIRVPPRSLKSFMKQAAPKLALAPIFALWFGFGITSKVVIAGLIAFFPLLENTLSFVSEKLKRRGIEVVREFEATPALTGDSERLQQLCLNLFLNGTRRQPESLDGPQASHAH